MANLRDIRRRIKSVKNTRQITRAMQLVSSSKMKRAQDSAIAGRPYSLILANMLNTVSNAYKISGETIEHPFFQAREVKRRGIIMLSSDKGLCGPLNTNLFRLITEEVKGDASFFSVGKKGAQFIQREGLDLEVAYEISDKAETNEIQANEKTITNFQLFSGFRHRFIDGIIPDCLNVNRNQPTYKQHRPLKPINPLVNELAPQGPSGAKSNIVCATITRPATVIKRHSGTVAMITP